MRLLPPTPLSNDTETVRKPPMVSVLMAVYNEEYVIRDKIGSLRKIDYPPDKIRIFIGSDCSSDRSNEYLAQAEKEDERFVFIPFRERRGKPSVINDLTRASAQWNPIAADHIFVITDANVLLEPTTIAELVKGFGESKIGLIDSHMINTGLQESGISQSENQYIMQEVSIKTAESRTWQTMMGPFGGCYALRSVCFRKIPAHYKVDDFYLAMCVFEQGYRATNALKARCYEAIPHAARVEFRRKKRIATGNWQNLTRFWKLWIPPFTKVGFSFFSHKILRWMGPFLLIAMLLSGGILARHGNFQYQILFFLLIGILVVPTALDAILRKLNIHSFLIRGLSYFFYMNLALLLGFVHFIKGVDSGTWERTSRTNK